MARIAFDSGILIALERGDPTATAWLIRATNVESSPLVSAAALAEVWREPPRVRLMRAVRVCVVEPVDEQLARAAGAAIGLVGAGLADALIAASAARAGALLVTADRADLDALADHFRSLRLATLS